MTKSQKAALVLNCLVVVFTIFATICVIIGFKFMQDISVLSEKNFKSFRYFTNLSNILAAIVAVIYIVFKFSPTGKNTEKLPCWLYLLKIASTDAVAFTMFITVFYLAPTSKTGYFSLFMNSNLFMHFVTPMLCIISFIFFEAAEKPSFKLSFAGIIPMALYASVYTPNVLLHLNNGKPDPAYDWYGFLAFGLNTIWIVLPLLVITAWLIALGLWGANKKIASS
ncbi:hypothetical protein [Treponema bryantii]|uniref:hypothetical protein n=1 Tax=Treponema bryantii TaxID=163 RepID=UPI002B3231FE|nr:hypothetical protein TRBR_21190 [Treponema bryantii]